MTTKNYSRAKAQTKTGEQTIVSTGLGTAFLVTYAVLIALIAAGAGFFS